MRKTIERKKIALLLLGDQSIAYRSSEFCHSKISNQIPALSTYSLAF